MKRFHVCLVGLAVGLAACEGPRTQVTQRDAAGNYITTADYEAMERSEFETAMHAGLQDFDERMSKLRERANELGGEPLAEFSDWAEDLEGKRVAFVNELVRTESALVDDWPERRSETLEAYYDLRECLDEAYEDVLES